MGADMNARDWLGTAMMTVSTAWSTVRSPPKRGHGKKVMLLLVAGLVWISATSGQQRGIDIKKSVMTVRVYKAGVFSALGHNHEISAPITGGAIDTSARQVELQTNAAALQVRDPEVS